MNVLNMDCVAGMGLFPADYFDSIVCDPPYELGFMGKSWDNSGIAYSVEMWRDALRVLKPGGHLLAFSGSRTYHRMTCAIEDAGFEIRDQIMWVYGSGFPKSLDVSKAIDKAAGARGHDGKGFNVVGVGESNGGSVFRSDHPNYVKPQGITSEARQWDGWGTALKPAHEPICVARKPLIGTVAANVLQHGTGAINIDACRVGGSGDVVALDAGRWPANFTHDGLPEDWARFFYCAKASRADRDEGLTNPMQRAGVGALRDGGRESAPRDNHHPTVKPTDLMRYLVRLVTPPGGTVLDPFTGSGSTGKAATLEGFGFIGFELDPCYAKIAQARIDHAVKQRYTEKHDEK